MRHINYNFDGFYDAYEELIKYSRDPKLKNKIGKVLKDLQFELNRFFDDKKCMEVLYTINTDKVMFGMCVMPVLNATTVLDDDKFSIKEYALEIDSKLLDPILDMTPEELTAITLHEIGHMVNGTEATNKIRANLDHYYAKTGTTFRVKSPDYMTLITYGIKDAVRKMYSIFDKKDDEILADEFVASYGLGLELERALTKIVKHSHTINRDVDNKFIVLGWSLRMYADLKRKRIPTLQALNKAKHLSPSTLEKREIEKVEKTIRSMDKFDDDMVTEGGIISKLKTSMYKKGVKGYADDLFEFKMLMRNIQHEDDALRLLHKINTRMAVISDYLEEDNIDPSEKKKWTEIYLKFDKLREELSNKTVYRDNYNRIYVDYPDIVPNRMG